MCVSVLLSFEVGARGGSSQLGVDVSLSLMSNLLLDLALPFVYQFTAGAIAGVTELLCLYPLGPYSHSSDSFPPSLS